MLALAEEENNVTDAQTHSSPHSPSTVVMEHPNDFNDNNNIAVQEEGEEAEEEGADGSGEQQSTERPKLDEGFYEIEAIQSKRVRKGKLQYLIKWRGWPETANTWEPLKNLQSCLDIIDAFEESFQSGKPKSTRGRKRKSETTQTPPEKKQQGEMIDAMDSASSGKLQTASDGKSLPNAPANDLTIAGHPTSQDVDATGTKLACEIAFTNLNSRSRGPRKEDDDLDMKLAELKGMDKSVMHFQQGEAPEANGFSQRNNVEPTPNNLCMGAKRRKSGPVKRFKQEPAIDKLKDAQNSKAKIPEPKGFRNASVLEANSHFKNANGHSKDKAAPTVTELITPIGYSVSVSNNVQNVSVTFSAMRFVIKCELRCLFPCALIIFDRLMVGAITEETAPTLWNYKSDGKRIMVDNKFLKAHNPLLLIDFYEQHLRYCP